MEFKCNICPRNCGADRKHAFGVCGVGRMPVVARAGIHMWEEPVISGDRGSGTVFFSGCPLKCVYCQNRKISTERFGREITVERLREIYFELIEKGVHNINLVSPTHYADAVGLSLQGGLPVPVVYNTGGYERVNTLRTLEGKIQIFLTDMKYASCEMSLKYSKCADYTEAAKRAIIEMYRQTGPYVINDDGIMTNGVIIRHMILPGGLEDTKRIIDWVSATFLPGEVLFSLMSQYTPVNMPHEYPELDRVITQEEHDTAIAYLEESGIEDGFYQDRGSAKESFIPEFDLSGI